MFRKFINRKRETRGVINIDPLQAGGILTRPDKLYIFCENSKKIRLNLEMYQNYAL